MQLGIGADQLRVIYNLTDRINRAEVLEEIYDLALDAVQYSLDVDRAALLLDDEQNVMRFMAWRGLSEVYRAAVEGHSPWPADVKDPEPVLIANVEEEQGLGELREVIIGEGIGSLAFIPLYLQGRLLGKFMLYHNKPHAFLPEEIQLARTIANHTAFAIDRRRAEEALRSSEERFSKAFRASPAAMTLVRAGDRRFLDANEIFLQITGYGLDEVVGRDAAELAIWADPSDRDRLAQTLFERGSARDFEAKLRTKSGEVRDVIGSAEIIAVQGETCVLALMRDVTDQRRRERRLAAQYAITEVLAESEALEESAERILQAVCESLGWAVGALWVVDSSTQILSCEYTWHAPWAQVREFIEISKEIGFPPGIGLPGRVWASGQPAWILDVTKDANFPRAPIAQKEGLHGAFGFPIMLGRTTIGVIEFFSPEIQEPDEDLLKMMGAVGSQIGQFMEKKRLEKEAGAARQRLAFLADASVRLASSLEYEEVLKKLAELVVPGLAEWCSVDIVEPDGAIRRIGVTPADPSMAEVAKTLESYPPHPMGKHYVVEVLATGKSIVHNDLEHKHLVAGARNQEHLQIMEELGYRSAMVVPLSVQDRRIGAITLIRTVSKPGFSESDSALVEELARRAAQALDNARLHMELLKVNEAKDEFLGLVSHELRTPITAILGGTRLLRTRSDLDVRDRADVLDDVEQQAARLRRLVEDLLVLARAELGHEVIREPVLIRRLIEKAIRSFKQRRPFREVALTLKDRNVIVAAAPSYLEQVLGNILSNADKYSPPDTRIEIQMRSDGAEATVSVLDEGPGITAEDVERIFDPFYRVHTTSKKTAGAGIGLTVCKRLIEAQSGRIWARARERRGLAISFSLPLYKE